MSLAAFTLTLDNQMTDKGKGVPNPLFDLVVYKQSPDFVDEGVVQAPPEDVPSTKVVKSNGGIYVSGPVESDIEGIAAWLLPGKNAIVVIYFSNTAIAAGIESVGTQLDAGLLKKIKESGTTKVTGKFSTDGNTYGFTVKGSNPTSLKNTLSSTIVFALDGKPEPEGAICLTIHNAMSSVTDKGDPAFDLPLVKPTADFMDSGVVRSDPIPVPSFTLDVANNGGIYFSPSTSLDGIVGYLMPDTTTIIVIYFDVTKILFKLKPKGTELDDKVVKEVAATGKPLVTGSFAIGRSVYDFKVTWSSSSPTIEGKTLNAVVDFFCKSSQ